MIFDDFAYEKMAALNVLGAIVVFGIIGEISSCSVITGECERTGCRWIDLVAKLLKIKTIL